MRNFKCLLLTVVLTCLVDADVTGGWADWSEWSGWGKDLCSGNQRVKTRSCTNPVPTDGGFCEGENAVHEEGPIHGGLSEWSQWTSCEKPCGGSVVNRTRSCTSPPPSNRGSYCRGKQLETKLECLMKCPESRTDGSWSPWSTWTPCPKTCRKGGGATIYRHRVCNMPPPMFGGSQCPGNATEQLLDCFNNCPIDGGFNTWSSFSPCSRTCGSGTTMRYRTCSNPEPKGENARNCTGSYGETRHCKLVDCVGAINGNWGQWTGWSQCSERFLCRKGVAARHRSCLNPTPNKGGDDCIGLSEETVRCPIKNCRSPPRAIPDRLPVGKKEYIYRECGATIKSSVSSKQVSSDVLQLLFPNGDKFKGGYYAMQEEEVGTIVKYCFEPWPFLSIREAASLVPSYHKSIETPNYKRPKDESAPVLGFSLRVLKATNQLKGYEFAFDQGREYVAGNKLKLHDVMFTYYSDGTHWGFLAKGDFRLFHPTVFKCVIFNNASDQTTSMFGKADSLTLKGFLNALDLPDDVGGSAVPVIKSLKNLQVWETEFVKPTIAYNFLHQFKAPFRISGSKLFGGIPLHFEMIYIHSGWDRKVAFGFSFDEESYGSVLEKMAGSSAAGKAITNFMNSIGLHIEVGVAWCPSFFGSFRVNKVSRFNKDPLKEIYKTEIPEGLTAVAMVGIPKDCKGSTFCEICKKVLGPKVNFRISANVKAGSLKAAAGFYKVKIYENYMFSKLELFTEVNTTSHKYTIGFKAEVQIPVSVGMVITDGVVMDRSLRLGGSLKHKIGGTDLTGSLYMRGMWHSAFGLSWLNIGNINLGITITLGSPIPVTGFQFGGQLEFGTNCLYDADFAEDGHCLRLQIYFGYGKPTYFFGKISALTIGKLVRMCGGKANLPDRVYRAGFKKDLRVSFNPSGKDVDLQSVGGPIVQNGFRLKGELDLFGYLIKVHIKYNSREIYIDGELDPLNLGKYLVMSRNESHQNVGPKLYFSFKRTPADALIKLPYWKIYFEGYLNLFGIKSSAYVNVTVTEMEVYLYGKIFDLIYAELYMSANYDYLNVKDADFYVRALIDMRKLTDAIERAKKSVQNAFDDAKKQLQDAIAHVKREKEKCKEKLKIKCSNCYALKCKQAHNNCKGFLNAAGKWIGGAINSAGAWVVNTSRSFVDGMARVGKTISKFLRGRRRRRELLRQQDEHFEVHTRKRRFVSKLICEGIVGGGCKGVSNLCYGTCSAVDYIGQGLCSTLDIAVGALKLAEKASGWVNSAVKFLLEMFLIHGIQFETGVGRKFNGFMVGAEIDLTIFGQRHYFGFQFDLNNPYRSIMSAKDGSLYRYKEGVRQQRTDPTYNPYDRPNPFSDFDLAGTFAIEALRTGDEDRLGACITAPTTKANEEMILVACNDTDDRQKWAYTLKGALINLFSKKCLVLPHQRDAKIFQSDCDDVIHKKMLRYDCDVKTRSFKAYRKNSCVSTVITSNLGPGSLQHHGSLKCVQVSQGNTLVLKSACQMKSTEFELSAIGHLLYHSRSLCVKASVPVAEGSSLELIPPSQGCSKFKFTKQGSLQHMTSRLCLQTYNNEMVPADNTELVLGRRCEYVTTQSATGDLPDPQMTFTFVPQRNKLHMAECSEFYNMKLEQRFSIMNEELNTVCSKHAEDLALNKIASQSSILHNGFPSRAVDGDFNFQWEMGSCMHTKEERDPWWRVDLGIEYIVTDVTIVNRGSHGDRLKNIQVHVGRNLMVRSNPVCHDRVYSAQDAEAVRVQCNPPIPGQFVGVQMYGLGILSMCEVAVASRLGGMNDWCQVENGGCDQICTSKCGSSETKCSCRPGFHIAYDGKTCFDVDECRSNHGGCRTDLHAFCVNTLGSFYCGCQPGYILKDDSLTHCIDVNECGIGNGGCEQMCNNTIGGYLCNCRQGYERKPDSPYGCRNVDECKTNNGGCDHTCHDYEGGHYCKCRAGYELLEDGKSCQELFCNVLEPPRWGVVSPAKCTKRFESIAVDSICNFKCLKGYEIKGVALNGRLQCRIDGTWSSPSPSCHPVTCPQLARPSNGGLVPSRCHSNRNEFAQRCVAYCNHGYRLRGPATKYCTSEAEWSHNASVECIKVIEPPFLNCPSDVTVTLSADKNSAHLGDLWRNVHTNIVKPSVQPIGVGPRYEFGFGRTLVSYTGKHDDGTTLTCSYSVHVKDSTPPHVLNCPSDITVKSSRDRETIRWSEPSFVDNVGVRQISKPWKLPGDVWQSSEVIKIRYSATDGAGNTVECVFTVRLINLKCPKLVPRPFTHLQTFKPFIRYSVKCSGQRTLFGNYGFQGSVVYCKDGEYFIDQTNIGATPPDCVSFTKTTALGVCPQGSEKFMHDDWFTGKTFYCAACPPGLFYESQVCKKCPIGTYQDEAGWTMCEPCRRGYSTQDVGARTETQCLEQCPAGTFSSSGLQIVSKPCQPCAANTYSPVNGSTFCSPCPDDTTTSSHGAKHLSDCIKRPSIESVLPGSVTSAVLGRNTELQCFFEGVPIPSARWEKVNGSLRKNSVQRELFDLDIQPIGISLILSNLRIVDSGKYKCTVQNKAGLSEKIIQLHVTPKL